MSDFRTTRKRTRSCPARVLEDRNVVIGSWAFFEIVLVLGRNIPEPEFRPCR